MARRVRFSIAQPITIVGWYISSIALVCLLGTAAGPLKIEAEKNLVWSQAFYYGLFAAILYFIDASLMVATVYGAHTNHYAKDFQLTTSQRTLMLQTIMYLVYLLVGALIFSSIEDWVYLDGVYWANQTLFTVGYGDFLVNETLSRALLIPYVLIGVITLGLLIGSIRSLILERGRRRLDARMVEKERRRIVRSMIRKGRDDILKPVRESHASSSSMANDPNMTEYERRRAEFLLMRQIQKRSNIRRRWVAVSISASVWLVLWLGGAAIFQHVEYPYQSWTYFDGFYFAFVTFMTLGYGDRTPVSPAGKSFYVFWTMMALPTMTILISNAGDTVILAIKNATLDLGSITILPSDRGVVGELKRVLCKLSCGRLFPGTVYSDDEDDDEIENMPPGFLGAARKRDMGDDTETPRKGEGDDTQGTSSSKPLNKCSNGQTGARRRGPVSDGYRSSPRLETSTTLSAQDRCSRPAVRDPRECLPSCPAEYHYLLATEIAAVSKDIKRKEPRRYTFSEWSWYLKLIGEDEANADTHRKARPHVHAIKKKGNSELERAANDTRRHGVNTKEVEHGLLNKQHRLHGRNSEAQEHNGEAHVDDASSRGVLEECEGNGEGSAAEGDSQGNFDRYAAEGNTWSWVGSRSPLMGSMEESEWILDKLTKKLMYELREARLEA